jgi:acetyltransferase-like isoleucine patch superfamily enzyme
MVQKIRKIYFTLLLLLTGEQKRARVISKFLDVKFGDNVRITGIPEFNTEPFLITIGNNVTITHGVTFHNHDGGVGVLRLKYPGLDVIKPIKIGNNVFIGSNTTIMPGVEVGNNVVIGASSVVTKNVPDNVVVAGIPAKVIKTIEQYEEKILQDALYLKNRKNIKKRKEEIIAKVNQAVKM